MNSYVNAQKGISKVFFAAILEILAAIAAGVVLFVVKNSLIDAIAGITSIAIIIFAYIFNLIGLAQAGKDEKFIRDAFVLAICGLIVAVVVAILNAIPAIGQTQIGNAIYVGGQLFDSIIEIGIVIYVCQGTANLLSLRNEEKLARSGSNTALLFAIIFALSAILNLICSLFTITTDTLNVGSVSIVVLSVIYIVLQFVALIRYLIFLGKAKGKLA